MKCKLCGQEKEDLSLGAYVLAFPFALIISFIDKVLDGIALGIGFILIAQYFGVI